jgi:acyl-CoA synthetase (AMP-forming)/AMP-acid ligase II
MTELPGLHANPGEYPGQCRLDSPGVPRSDSELRIVDPETLEDVAPGEEGELIARSPARMLGYLPESANEGVLLPGGWIRTGDLGRVDDQGWLYLTDRLKDVIKVSGLQVAPAEIEAQLLGHESIADCAVIGVPHPDKGEVPIAFVVAAGPDHDDAALAGWLADRLSRYKVPAEFVWVDDIPRTASGKTLRRELRDMRRGTEAVLAGDERSTHRG